MDYKQYKNKFTQIVGKIDNLDFKNVYNQETSWEVNKAGMGKCPFCNSGNHSHSGSDGAFKIYNSSNMAKCYSCGTSAGTVKLIMHIHKLDYKQAIHYIAKNYFNEVLINPYEEIKFPEHKRTLKEKQTITSEQQRKEEVDKKRIFNYIKNLVIENKDISIAKGYLSARSLTKIPEDFYFQANAFTDKYKTELPAGVVFFDSTGNLLNKRYCTNDLPEGVKKTFSFGKLRNAIYDRTFNKENDTLFITEGVINALSLYAIRKSAIATFSTSNILDDKYKFWQYFYEKNIVLAYDGDKAGQQAALKIADFILSNFKITSLKILLFPDKYDINNLLSTKELDNHINNDLNYFSLNKTSIKIHKEKLNTDYVPFGEYNSYSFKPATDKDKLKFKKLSAKDTTEVFTSLNIDTSKFNKKHNFFPVEFIQYKKGDFYHKYTATKEQPIILFNYPDGNLIWRPNTNIYGNFTVIDKIKSNFLGGTIFIDEIEERRSELLAAAETENKKSFANKKPIQSLFLTFNVKDFLSIIAAEKPALLLTGNSVDYEYYNDVIKPNTWDTYMLPANNFREKYIAKNIGLYFIEIKTFALEEKYNSISDYIEELGDKLYIFFRKLNSALPIKFWEYEKGEVKLNLIYFLNFLQNKGFYAYENLKDKYGYQYIEIKNKIVKKHEDKDMFVRFIKTFTNQWLEERSEKIKIRNKILTSGEFSEKNIGQIRQIRLNFENSGKEFQNFFFDDGYLWHITKDKIERVHQSQLNNYIWENDLIKAPSKIKKAPFKISYSNEYTKLLNELKNVTSNEEKYEIKKHIRNLSENEKYNIQIIDRNNYFLQFLWLTSFQYWKEAEKKGYEIKPEDFWYQLESRKILSQDKIDDMKLHLINKITWIGYFVKDFRGPEHDYGLAILDSIDLKNEGLKREAAGGGKSLIALSLEVIKRVYKAENSAAEDFATNKHRYENYDDEKVMLIDDMHKHARIGDILTDFSNGITVNPKHKKPIPVPLERSPKIIVTRNYIDMEGARVDRRLGRIFVCDYFHKTNGGKYKQEVTPKSVFGFSFFNEENDEQKSDLVNFFAYAYQSNMQFGEINSPTEELLFYRILKEVGDQLIEYLDNFREENSENYIDLLWMFTDFKSNFKETFNSFQRTKQYNSSANFKRLVKLYCEVNNLVFTPEELLNNPKSNPTRIMRRSTRRFDDQGYGRSCEHIYIATNEEFLQEFSNVQEENNIEQEQPQEPQLELNNEKPPF